MTIENLLAAEDLAGFARRAQSDWEFKTVRHSGVEEEAANGWEVEKRNKTTTRLKRRKPAHGWFEDRVWSLMYKLGFAFLNAQGGAKLSVATSETAKALNQLDVVAIDDESALAIECKSTRDTKRLPDFARITGKLQAVREPFLKAIRTQLPSAQKRQIGLVLFTENVVINEADGLRAEQQNIVLFDEQDLKYYEELVAQIGGAAKYQFLAHVFPNKTIPGLELKVPAIRSKMGGRLCYSFSISPEYLLKIAFVSHRARGKASDIDTYQRLIKKARLQSIRRYITENGTFPTNLVLNADPKALRFERAKQETEDKTSTVGWLTIRPWYKAAWVIDGQHRLFAYSGHPYAAKSLLTVLCFSGLEPSQQAEMFIKINAEQRKVKQSLLQELFAELHWTSDDPEVRVQAILSKAIQALDILPGSALRGRILKADDRKDHTRCISLTSIFKVLENSSLLIGKVKGGHVVEFGPLWAGTNEATLRRVITAINGWLNVIVGRAQHLWDMGSGEGGGMAMNDGITVILWTVRSVISHLQANGVKFAQLSDVEIVDVAKPYLETLGDYFGNMPAETVRSFRALRGGEGHGIGMRRCQQAIRAVHPNFNPQGLDDFLKREKAETNKHAYEVITRIELLLQASVLGELRVEFGEEESGWWFTGVPSQVRKKIYERVNEEDGKSDRQDNFDLIDYRTIILANWSVFESRFGQGKGNKENRTKWIVEVNNIRKSVMHASKSGNIPITEEKLQYLLDTLAWLNEQLASAPQMVMR